MGEQGGKAGLMPKATLKRVCWMVKWKVETGVLDSDVNYLCDFESDSLVPGLLVGSGPDNPPLKSSQSC